MDKEKRSERNLQSPCQGCPFRSDIAFVLPVEKVEAILDALRGDRNFPCHNTTIAMGYTPGQERGCIGATIFLEHVREGGLRANRTFRLRERWRKEFKREELDTDAPVFTSEVDFVVARTMTLSD